MKKIVSASLALLLLAPLASLEAKDVSRSMNVDCSMKTLQSQIDKLDKSTVNTLHISGHCTEDVVISSFADLTLVGTEGASLTASSFLPDDLEHSTTALFAEHSKLTVDSLRINGGSYGIYCVDSTCVLRDTLVEGGHNSVAFQDQSEGFIIGSSTISNSVGAGLGIYGASSVNIRSTYTWPPGPGPVPVISGHSVPVYNPDDPTEYWGDDGYGVIVQDGSFLRADDVTFSGNGYGIYAQRDAMIKIYGNTGGVMDNVDVGIFVNNSSTAAVSGPVTGNGGAGIFVGPLSLFHNQGITFSDNAGGDVACGHPTAISRPLHWCGN